MTTEERVQLLRAEYGTTELLRSPPHVCITTQRKMLAFAEGAARLESQAKNVYKAPPGYWTSREYALMRGITLGRMRERLQEGKEPGAEKNGDYWIIKKRDLYAK